MRITRAKEVEERDDKMDKDMKARIAQGYFFMSEENRKAMD
jgi:hypothetical protein